MRAVQLNTKGVNIVSYSNRHAVKKEYDMQEVGCGRTISTGGCTVGKKLQSNPNRPMRFKRIVSLNQGLYWAQTVNHQLKVFDERIFQIVHINVSKLDAGQQRATPNNRKSLTANRSSSSR